MNYNFSKHYYDPFIQLKEEEWKDVVSRGFLSISEAATLSGYTRQYISTNWFKQARLKVNGV